MTKKRQQFRMLSEREMNILRGKAMCKATTPEDTIAVLNHLALLEMRLDEADFDDALGTEGWRHFVGMPEK